MKILVVTTEPDPHMDMVKAHMSEATWIIFDPAKFPDDLELSYNWLGNKLVILYNGIDISDVDIVWYRKPIMADGKKLHVEAKYREMVLNSYKKVITWLYDVLTNAVWVSDYRAIIRANNKLWQMQVASSFGFKIPATLVTNDAVQAQRFLAIHENVVVKALNPEFIHDDGKILALYTTRLNREFKLDFSGLAINPMMFQEEILGAVDLRVTVVGEKVFACKITKNAEFNPEVDWRKGIAGDQLQYEVAEEFPSWASSACVKMLKEMGLKYGVFDFMLTAEGELWFLELNPNGQWAFIELGTNMPISEEFKHSFESLTSIEEER